MAGRIICTVYTIYKFNLLLILNRTGHAKGGGGESMIKLVKLCDNVHFFLNDALWHIYIRIENLTNVYG